MVKSIISPSMLSADFANLASEAKRMVDAGADWLHMDVMDGAFVPNLTIGAPVIKSLRPHTGAFLDCHLMVQKPEQWVKDFADAGADMFTFHIEATAAPADLIASIRAAGMKVGVAIKPSTPIDEVLPLVEAGGVDMVLVMTVEPGYGGQKFMPHMMPKVTALRQRFPNLDIQVDGGLDLQTIHAAATAGANVIVAGTAIFKHESPAYVISTFKQVVDAQSSNSQ